MPIDAWFPLAIYRTKLEEGDQYKDAFLKRIWALRETRPQKRTDNSSSWTGDVHGIDMVHADSTFDWLTQQVGHYAFQYLEELGYDLSLCDLYFQRSWPVIGDKKQAVAPHTHPTAHLSAVYYVSIPTEGNPGKICFFNDANPNELFKGVGSQMTNGYKRENLFNTPRVNYQPEDGWLILFPSSLNHAVEANDSTDYRVSISYDLILTATEPSSNTKAPEFLMPSPTRWRKASLHSKQAPAASAKSSQSQSQSPESLPSPAKTLSLADIPEVTPFRSPQQEIR